jgi:hypothetical protein
MAARAFEYRRQVKVECSLQHKERSVPLSLNLSPKLILAAASAHPDADGTVPVAF